MTPSKLRGSALLITIFFISIIMLVALGFTATCGLERASSHSHLERQRAAELARNGIEETIGTLRRETAYRFLAKDSDGAQRFYYRNYITQPGALIVPTKPTGQAYDTTQATLREVRLLSSGKPATTQLHTNKIFEPPNLNVVTFESETDPTYLITDQLDPNRTPGTNRASEMRLKWIYVREDRTSKDPSKWNRVLDLAENPTEEPRIESNRPIVGRYAYWTDDESSKINYNLAWKRDPELAKNEVHQNSNTARFAHPSRVNLLALTSRNASRMTEDLADKLHLFTTQGGGHFYNSFADARQVKPEISSFLDFNKFSLTHYNHDPDTTFFGEDRILLTTNPNLVPTTIDPVTGQKRFTRKFLDILRDDKPLKDLDPGRMDDIAGGQNGVNKFNIVVRNLIRYISEKNWPLSPGQSFAEKYSYGKTSNSEKARQGRLGQLAVNIIDYVRSKESKELFVSPTRFAVDTTTGAYSMAPGVAYGATDSFQGISRSPYFTEMGLSIAAQPEMKVISGGTKAVPLYRCVAKFELYLPSHYDLPDGVDLCPNKGDTITNGTTKVYYIRIQYIKPITGTPKSTYYWQATAGTPDRIGKLLPINSGTYAVPIMLNDIAGNSPTRSILRPGNYITVTKVFYREENWLTLNTPAANNTGMRAALHCGTVGADGFLGGSLNDWPRINICPQSGATIPYIMGNPATTDENNMRSVETDDPRANVAVKDWKYNKNGVNTFNAINSVSTLNTQGPVLNPSPISAPQQDVDSTGKLTDYSVYMPAPKGTAGTTNAADKDNGAVTSIAELGYINTGADAVDGSVPWRSIRLQPNCMNLATTLPDWAFMDLFGVPNQSILGPADPLYTPHGTSLGGRINVNSHVAPFKEMIRDSGLTAALMGTKSLSTVEAAANVAKNIYNRTLAGGTNKGKVYGYPFQTNPGPDDPNAYDTPGEICEIKGVADTGEQSEDLVREIASLLTSRGDVFSIYTIGQAIVQTPTGKLVVTGEQRQHAMVERYLENQGTIETNDDEVRFRTVYFRNLSP